LRPEARQSFADRLHAPRPRRVPAWRARWFLGRETTRFLTTGFPTSAELFRESFGWEPSVPTFREGLDRVVDRWVEDGSLREKADGFEWTGD
jgi:hypothetical protein